MVSSTNCFTFWASSGLCPNTCSSSKQSYSMTCDAGKSFKQRTSIHRAPSHLCKVFLVMCSCCAVSFSMKADLGYIAWKYMLVAVWKCQKGRAPDPAHLHRLQPGEG